MTDTTTDQRLAGVLATLDGKIRSKRKTIVSLGSSLALDLNRVVEATENGETPHAPGRSSGFAQLNEAIAELTVLVDQRTLLTFVATGETS